MKFYDCLKIMYFRVKLISEWENDQIKTIEIEQNGEKMQF